MRSSILVLAAAALACGAFGEQPAADPLLGEPVPVLPLPAEAQLYFRFNSGACAPSLRVVRTAEEWASTWAELAANHSPIPAPPTVDFAAEMLLVATMGQRLTGGYFIDVERAAAKDGTLHAYVLETSPGPTCATTQALTCPAAVVRVARRDGPVAFATRTTVHECGP
jgi:hypothetical protein